MKIHGRESRKKEREISGKEGGRRDERLRIIKEECNQMKDQVGEESGIE